MDFGSIINIKHLFCDCENLTVIPKNAFYTDSRGINGKYLFSTTSKIVAIWVPLRFYCEDSGHNTYYQDATDISPTHSMSKENWLTDGNTFGKLVYLGENDSADNWKEITNEEKEAIEAQRVKDVEGTMADDTQTENK